jgi:murein DD-endopeptidase MepM/ murein hydrolase activator NlpD
MQVWIVWISLIFSNCFFGVNGSQKPHQKTKKKVLNKATQANKKTENTNNSPLVNKFKHINLNNNGIKSPSPSKTPLTANGKISIKPINGPAKSLKKNSMATHEELPPNKKSLIIMNNPQSPSKGMVNNNMGSYKYSVASGADSAIKNTSNAPRRTGEFNEKSTVDKFYSNGDEKFDSNKGVDSKKILNSTAIKTKDSRDEIDRTMVASKTIKGKDSGDEINRAPVASKTTKGKDSGDEIDRTTVASKTIKGKDSIDEINRAAVDSKAIKKRDSIEDMIQNNNQGIIEDLVVPEDDVLKAYALPQLRIAEEGNHKIIEEHPEDKINKDYIINQKPVNDNQGGINEREGDSRIKIIKPVNKGVQVKRTNHDKKKQVYYQELLEDGRDIKRSYTIQENTTITEFLINNGVEENKAESFNGAMKDSVGLLKKGQYVILKLEKIPQYFKQHKPIYEGQYNLKKITIFFKDCILVFKFKKGRLINKKYYVDDRHSDFSVITFEKLEDFDKLVNLQHSFSKTEYDFLSQAIEYLSNKLFHQKITINSIKLICQKTNKDNKTRQKIRGLFVYTPKEKFYCYIYKDFSDNYHLLRPNGNSFNLEVLDVQSNPPLDGRVSSLFGFRRHPVLKRTRHHGGLDLAAPTHTPIYAVLNGWILSAGTHKTYGNYVIISYGNLIYTLYGHMQKIFVKTGDYVETGRLIGSVGNTGLSSGPHLHYEIFQSDVNFYTIDPEKVNLLFNNRSVLDPALRYKIGIGLRTAELPYFLNLINNLHNSLKGVV